MLTSTMADRAADAALLANEHAGEADRRYAESLPAGVSRKGRLRWLRKPPPVPGCAPMLCGGLGPPTVLRSEADAQAASDHS